MAPSTPPPAPLKLVHHVVLWAVLAASLAFAWTGFIASDDEYYALAGLGWLNEFPYVASHFGTIRAVVGIPIAVMIGLFGEREFTIVLSTCLFFAASASVTLSVLARLIGNAPALVASAVMTTVPLLALKSTIASADLPELFFVVCSFWLFWIATRRESRIGVLLSAGACAALAFSAHEVTVALLVFYGILFLGGYGIARRQYWVMALGFLTVMAAECVYYWIFAGDPFHRYALLQQGAAATDRIAVGVGEIAAGGTLHVWAPLDPLLMLFTKHEFGLLGFIAVPAVWWAWASRRVDCSHAIAAARLASGLGAVWLLVATVALRNLILLPRYYMVSAYCLCVVVALWTAVELWPRRRRLVAAGVALFVTTNLLAIYVDNRNPRFGERALVAYLKESSGPVHTDPMTADDVHWYCRWAKVDCTRIVSGPPAPGRPYFHNPKNAGQPSRFVTREQVHLYQLRGEWPIIWQKEEPRRLAGIIMDRVGLAALLPRSLVAKVDSPNSPVRVFRVTE